MSGEGPLSCCPPRGEGQGAFWGPLHKSAVPIHEGHLLTFQRSHLRGQNSEQERRPGARAMLQIVTQGGDSAVFRRSWAAPRGTDLMQRARSAGPLSSLFQGSVLGWAVCEDTGGSASCGKDTFPCISCFPEQQWEADLSVHRERAGQVAPSQVGAEHYASGVLWERQPPAPGTGAYGRKASAPWGAGVGRGAGPSRLFVWATVAISG